MMMGLPMLLVVLASCSMAYGAKIVMLPMVGMSHLSQAGHISNALVEKGHDVYMILPDNYKELDKYKSGQLKILTHHTPEQNTYQQNMTKLVTSLIGKSFTKVISMGVPGGRENCRNVLSDQKLYQELKDLKPAIFLLDSHPFCQCVYTLPYRLGVRYVSYGTAELPQWARSPALPSFVPMIVGTPYSQEMTFFERLDNLLTVLDWAWFPKPPYIGDDWVARYAPERPPVPMDVLLRRSSLWLINSDNIIEYPRPQMPNEIFVGGLTTKPAKPLTSDLEKIVSSAQHGVIVMSFGSGLPDLHSEKFLRVFTNLKQVVLWRHVSEYDAATPVPTNVHMLKWLPQSDLLGHNNTRLFITHGGSNGQFEALYHGIPMLAFPALGDQPFNAERMAYHGFGKVMNILSFTEQELEHAIVDIISDPSYTRKIKHASKIYHSRLQKPIERVAYWVDHVVKYGDEHLKSYAVEMPWYSYWMLDIFLFFAAVDIVVIYLVYRVVRRCCQGRSKQKSE